MKLLILTLPMLIAVASSSLEQNFTLTIQQSSENYVVQAEDNPPPKQPKGRGEGRRDFKA